MASTMTVSQTSDALMRTGPKVNAHRSAAIVVTGRTTSATSASVTNGVRLLHVAGVELSDRPALGIDDSSRVLMDSLVCWATSVRTSRDVSSVEWERQEHVNSRIENIFIEHRSASAQICIFPQT